MRRALAAAGFFALASVGCAWVETQSPAPGAEARPAASTLIPARDPSAPAAVSAATREEGEGSRQWTYGAVRGTVSSVKRDGGVVIGVAIGRKTVEFLVPVDSPRAAQLAGLLGVVVEAEGKMEFGRAGERILFATEVTEVAEK